MLKSPLEINGRRKREVQRSAVVLVVFFLFFFLKPADDQFAGVLQLFHCVFKGNWRKKVGKKSCEGRARGLGICIFKETNSFW